MRILVIDESPERRADLVDALCELPGVEVRGAAANAAETGWRLTAERSDTLVIGEIPGADRAAIDALATGHDCAIVGAGPDIVAEITALAAERERPATGTFAKLAARSKYLGLDKGVTETIDLAEWLPRVIAHLKPLLPELVEVHVMVAHGTQSVCCVPDVLEHVVVDLVVHACRALPWGGIVWLTASPGDDGEVKLDVLENGGGSVLDLTLLAAVSATAPFSRS